MLGVGEPLFKRHFRFGSPPPEVGVSVGVPATGVGVVMGVIGGGASGRPVAVAVWVTSLVGVTVPVRVAPPDGVRVGVTPLVRVLVGVTPLVRVVVGVAPPPPRVLVGVAAPRVSVRVAVAVGVPGVPGSSQKLVVGAGVPHTGSLLLVGCTSALFIHSERLKQRDAAAPLSLYSLLPTKLSGSVKAKPRQPVLGQSTNERSPGVVLEVPLAEVAPAWQGAAG